MAIKIKTSLPKPSEDPVMNECGMDAISTIELIGGTGKQEIASSNEAISRSKSGKISAGFSLYRVLSTALTKSKTDKKQNGNDGFLEEAVLPLSVDETEPEEEIATAEIIDRSKLGWHSPSYSVSRSILLDPKLLHANRCIAFDGETTTIDSYKVIRAQILQRMAQSGGNTLMVTSSLPGEGKTTTSINLALIMAKEFQQTVLLVDCDLQQQDIHKNLGYSSDKGLINYLLDDCPITELFTWPNIEKITLISGGRTIRDSSELLGSPRMKELVSDLKSRYPNRFIIFDMQSTFAGADTMVFAPMVDNILMVVQEGNSSAKDIKRAISLLPEEKILGLMLNRHKASSHIIKHSKSHKNIRHA
jgi:non-specific protein-tyrosine kinase